MNTVQLRNPRRAALLGCRAPAGGNANAWCVLKASSWPASLGAEPVNNELSWQYSDGCYATNHSLLTGTSGEEETTAPFIRHHDEVTY